MLGEEDCGMPGTEKPPNDPDNHKGAVEGNQPDDPQHSNRSANQHAATLTRDGGPPADSVVVARDRIGANTDDPEVSNAGEAGQTSDSPRDEQAPQE
jgi:hypothetical protein